MVLVHLFTLLARETTAVILYHFSFGMFASKVHQNGPLDRVKAKIKHWGLSRESILAGVSYSLTSHVPTQCLWLLFFTR
jgi:hypothetical protein